MPILTSEIYQFAMFRIKLPPLFKGKVEDTAENLSKDYRSHLPQQPSFNIWNLQEDRQARNLKERVVCFRTTEMGKMYSQKFALDFAFLFCLLC